MPRNAHSTELQVFPEEREFGRIAIPGVAPLLTNRKLRSIAHGRESFSHRSKNGVHDPYSYWHLLDAVLQVLPEHPFRVSDLLPYLQRSRTALIWDAITVGRLLNDIAESLNEANGRPALRVVRRWNGVTYYTSALLEDRIALMNLLEDLTAICEDVALAEADGTFPQRLDSPLLGCASLAWGLVPAE